MDEYKALTGAIMSTLDALESDNSGYCEVHSFRNEPLDEDRAMFHTHVTLDGREYIVMIVPTALGGMD